jgi:hypothetical protein
VAGTAGQPGRFAGRQLSIDLTWQLDRHIEINLGYVHFDPARVLKMAGGRDVDFTYLSATYKFWSTRTHKCARADGLRERFSLYAFGVESASALHLIVSTYSRLLPGRWSFDAYRQTCVVAKVFCEPP